jgi:hypothetical protein
MSLATLATVASVTATTVKSYGTYAGLQAQSVQEKYNAQISRSNIELRKQRKADIRLTGARAVKELETDAIKIVGRQATAFAGAGIDISSQVVGERIEETARVRAGDIITLQENIRKQLWGEDVGILSDRQQALLADYRSKIAGQLAPITAITELFAGLTGAAAGAKARVTGGAK